MFSYLVFPVKFARICTKKRTLNATHTLICTILICVFLEQVIVWSHQLFIGSCSPSGSYKFQFRSLYQPGKTLFSLPWCVQYIPWNIHTSYDHLSVSEATIKKTGKSRMNPLGALETRNKRNKTKDNKPVFIFNEAKCNLGKREHKHALNFHFAYKCHHVLIT